MGEKETQGTLADWAFRHHYGDVYRYFLRRTGNEDDAEDLTQRVFADAAAALSTSPMRRTDLLAWLYTVARRRFADEARRRRRSGGRPASLDAVGTPEAPTSEYGSGVAHAIREALSRLPPNAREVIVLRLLEGRSFAQIAEAMGATEAAVKMRFVRALRVLRAELEQRGIEP